MNIRFWQIILFVLCLAFLEFFVMPLEMLSGYGWRDLPLHFFGGMFCAIVGVWILGGSDIQPMFGRPSLLMIAVSIVFVFALGGSFLWEIFEWAFTKYAPQYLLWLPFYSSTASDTLSDMGMGFLGGVCIAFFDFWKRRQKN